MSGARFFRRSFRPRRKSRFDLQAHPFVQRGSAGSGARRKAPRQAVPGLRCGFDCTSRAWPDPGHRSAFEFCENGAKAVTWEDTPVTVASEFWTEHPISALRERSECWLGMQGRLAEPVYRAAGEDRCRPVSWAEAISRIAGKLEGLGFPDQAVFYTSGRACRRRRTARSPRR